MRSSCVDWFRTTNTIDKKTGKCSRRLNFKLCPQFHNPVRRYLEKVGRLPSVPLKPRENAGAKNGQARQLPWRHRFARDEKGGLHPFKRHAMLRFKQM